MLDRKGALSDEKNVTSVQRESIYGPLFFFIICKLFVNDYLTCIKHSNVNIYAGNTTHDVFCKSIDVIEQKMYKDLLYCVK